MTRYSVNLQTIASAYVTVDADDPEGAIEAAFEHTPGVCAQCSGRRQPWGLELGEWEIPRNDDDTGDADWAVEEVEGVEP